MEQILWDRENDLPATNWDGTNPIVIDGTVFITDLGCNCNPASGSTCGGCIETSTEFVVGENERYYYKTHNNRIHKDGQKDARL